MDLVRATRQAIERRMSIADLDGVLDMFAGGGAPSYSGKLVSPRNALGVSAVWACVQGLAKDFATLPILTYRWLDPGTSKEQARDHYLWPLLTEEANSRMSAHRFKKVMETWRQLWGNAYAEVETNGRGQVIALWPWRPDRVKVWPEDRSDVRSRIFYSYYPVGGGKPITLGQDNMLHVRGVSLDGVTGLSPVEIHRQTIGLQLAMTEHAARFFSNGAVIKGVLEHPGKVGDKGMESLRSSMDEYRGLSNSHRMLILEEGMEYKEIGMKLADAQFLENQNYTGEDICRIYGYPAHRAGFLERATNNNIEQLAMEYVQYGLGPNAADWCGEIHCSLLSARERDSIFTEPNFKYLLAADHQARAAFYQALGNLGAYSPDDIRHDEGRNPLPGGVGKLPRVMINTEPIGSPNPRPSATLPALPGNETKPNGAASFH